jgi:hypothetical protein
MLGTHQFLAYVQCFYITNPPAGQTMDTSTAGLHLLKCATRNNKECVGGVLPLSYLQSPIHLIPHCGKIVNPYLFIETSYELLTELWLNHY